MKENMPLAGIELGGTKSIALLASGGEIIERITIPTTTPQETLPRLRKQLESWYEAEPFAAIGIASFGPLQLDRQQDDFGCMLKTPKPHWSGARIAEELTSSFACPWAIDTDVNGAALAEYRWGAGTGCESLCYVTIGTGLGGGLVIHGKPVHGAMHPEMGHIRLRRAAADDFQGTCPFHGDCIEGLVSGPALAARFGAPPDTVPDDHPTWRRVASDLAEFTATILLTTSAQRILFGGGVSSARPYLVPMIRELAVDSLGNYLPFLDTASAERIISVPTLGDEAGPLGAIALALVTLER